MPNVLGDGRLEATRKLRQAGFKVRERREPSDLVPENHVIDMNPSPGSLAQVGSEVSLTVSTGRKRVEVPDVTGLRLKAAQKVLTTAHLTVQSKVVPSQKPQDTVLSQDPSAGTRVANGSRVTLSVAKGPALVAVPALQGLTQANAVAAIENAGLVPVVIRVPSSEPQGTVIAQDPPRGQKVSRGSKVRINVSQGTNTSPSTTTLTVVTGTTATTTHTRTVATTVTTAP